MDQRLGSFTASDGRKVAYAVVGQGPTLVLAPWWVSHLERHWVEPDQRTFFESLGAHHTVVRYDRPGVGLSQRDRGPCTLDTEVDYLVDVVDHLGLDTFDLLGISCGGPPAVALAAAQPHRVRKLALFGTYARGSGIAPPDSRVAFVAFTRTSWGLASRTLTDLFDPGATAKQIKAVAEDQLACASAGTAADLLALTYDMDVSDAAPRVQAPTLVMHRRSDRAIRHRLGEELATLIPAATLRSLEGEEHLPWSGDRAAAVAEIELFLTGRRTVAVTRKLATVMFSDIVGSTEQASASGDERWRRVLDVHDHELRRQLEHFGGRAVKYLGDGVLALFDLPTAAIFCAAALRQQLATRA